MFYDEKEVYYIFSKDRLSGDATNFTYRILLPENTEFDYAGVLAASIPKTYYLIDEYNDEFTLVEETDHINIKLDHGNYTLTAFTNALITTLNQHSTHSWSYVVIPPMSNIVNTGKIVYTVSGNGGSQPSFIFTESLYKQMGFNVGTYTFDNNKLMSENVINLQLLSRLYIHSDMCSNKNNDILQEVYSNTQDFSNITYQATAIEGYSKRFVTNKNNVYRFVLTDDSGDNINLNGGEWSFTLMCYKKNTTLPLINHFIKYNLLKE